MRDLIVNDKNRWIWNGKAYADSRPAPEINLKPRPSPNGQAHRR
jgi:hypothetical protein